MARARTIDNSTGGMMEGDQQGGAVLRQPSPFTGMGPDQSGQPNLGQPSPDDILKQVPTPIDPISGRSGESPRERDQIQNPSGQESQSSPQGAPTSTLRRPSSPTPMAGSSFTAGGGSGVMPFNPMTSSTEGPNSMVPPSGGHGGGLFGSMGGLKGGGLGVPLDPISDQQSDPISMLLKLLQRS